MIARGLIRAVVRLGRKSEGLCQLIIQMVNEVRRREHEK
jgi:hypothetical protein